MESPKGANTSSESGINTGEPQPKKRKLSGTTQRVYASPIEDSIKLVNSGIDSFHTMVSNTLLAKCLTSEDAEKNKTAVKRIRMGVDSAKSLITITR